MIRVYADTVNNEPLSTGEKVFLSRGRNVTLAWLCYFKLNNKFGYSLADIKVVNNPLYSSSDSTSLDQS